MFDFGYAKDQIVEHNDICTKVKCGCMGGIRYSKTTNVVILFMKENSKYNNFWVDGELHFMGSGKGNQAVEKGSNKVLSEAEKKGSDIFLFERIDDSKCRYIGPVKITRKPIYETVKNKFGEDEKKVVFFLEHK